MKARAIEHPRRPEEPQDLLRVLFPVHFPNIAVGRALRHVDLLARPGDPVVQPFVVRKRHAAVRRTAHQEHGGVPQAGHRAADVQGIDFYAHAELRYGARQVPEGHRGEAEHAAQVALQRFGGGIETAFGYDGVDPGYFRRREQRGGGAHGNAPQDDRTFRAPFVDHVAQGRLHVPPFVIAERRQAAFAVPVAAEIEQERRVPVFMEEGGLVEHLAPVVEVAVAVYDRAPAGLVRDVPRGQVQAVGSRQRHVFVGHPMVRGGGQRLAPGSDASGVQGGNEVGQADEDKQKNDRHAHGRASIGYLSPAHGQGRDRPDEGPRDEGDYRPQHDVGDDQAEKRVAPPGEVFAFETGRLAQDRQQYDQQADARRIEQ